MQRRGVEEHFCARDQRHDGAASKTKRVEQRQRDHEFVGWREVDHGANLGDVGEDAAMAMHHALGFALGAAGEEHHGRIVRPALLDGLCRKPARKAQQPEFVQQAELPAQIFQINHVDTLQRSDGIRQLGGFKKLARGEDGFYIRRDAGILHACRTCGVVEHGWDATHRAHAENQAHGVADIG